MGLTGDGGLAGRIRLLRHHGLDLRGEAVLPGYTARLDALQAAVLLAKWPFLDGWTKKRQDNARRYREALAGRAGFQSAGKPGEHVYHQFSIRVADRERVQEGLGREGIPSAVYYPPPLHLQQAYRHYGSGPGSLPVAESLAREVLSLPVCPALAADHQRLVIEALDALLPRG